LKNQQRENVIQLIEQISRQNELYQKMLTGLATKSQKSKDQKCRNGFQLNQKEISKLPTLYKNIFATDDMIVHYRLRQDGIYEARFHRQGINVEVSSKDLKQLKQKFIAKLNNQPAEAPTPKKVVKKVKLFSEIADEWLNVKRVTTKPSTLKEYERMLFHDVLPVFGDKPVTEIERTSLQNFLLLYVERGVLRTAHKIYLLLRCIFDMVAEDYSIPSPMKKVVVPNYEVKKGSAFTYDEEKKLVNHCLANLDKPTSHALLVLLYTGLRRSELSSIRVIDNTWLECETSKEKLGKNVVKRRIPFTPMMKLVLPYIDFEKAKGVNLNSLHTTMKRIFPDHHLHELRYTFITRIKECGVHGEIVLLWDGHEEDKSLHSSKVDREYTDFSEGFQLKEAEKVDYLKWELGKND
jgi:integrase